MVSLQILTGFLYDWVASSWMVSTILIKQIMILHVAKLFIDEEITLEHLEEIFMKYSRLVVTLIVTLGLIAVSVGFEMQARFLLFSQAIALTYFGFLFWRF